MSVRKLPSYLLVLVSALLAGTAGARTYYVDFENGSDSNNGLSPETAWKRAPGDDGSTGVAKNLTLQPGDRVLFRGGVHYRGTMMPRAAGTSENPVIFDGGSWGTRPAVIDGSRALPGARKCANAAECFGNPHWKHLWRIPLPSNALWTDWLFAGNRPLQPAQYPDVPLSMADDTDRYLTVPRAHLKQLQAGIINHALPEGFDRGMPVLALWIQGNVIAATPNISVAASGIRVDGGGWVNGSLYPYTDRDNKFALMNVPAMVRRPGTYAMSARDGYAIAWPWTPLQTDFSTGAGRYGINLARANHAVFRGFTFANYAGRAGNANTGIAILSQMPSQGIVISNNIFRAAVNWANGRAIMSLMGASTTIDNNIFTELPWTSAIQIDHSAAPILIRCNQISNIGRTGIRLHNTANVHVDANFLTQIKSVHGNGITLYGDTRAGKVTNNVVVDTYRPLTMNGVSSNYFSSGKKSILIANNRFMSVSPNSFGIVSYGNTQNATVVGNFVSAPNTAMDLRGTEVNFTAESNTFVGKVNVHNKADMFDASANIFQEAAGNGALLTGAVTPHGLPQQCGAAS